MSHAHLSCPGLSPLDVRSFRVDERAGAPYAIEVVARAEDPAISFAAAIGGPISLTLTEGERSRTFAGVLASAEQTRAARAIGRSLSTYRLRIASRMWLLSQRAQHRVFVQRSVIEIVGALLAEWGVPASWRVDPARHPKLDLRVQAGESDLDFAARLLEEAGIGYVAGGADGGVVLGDDLAASPPHGAADLTFEDEPTRAMGRPIAFDVVVAEGPRVGPVSLRDHDFRRPVFDLVAGADGGGAPAFTRRIFAPQSFVVQSGDADRHDEGHGQRRAATTARALAGPAETARLATNVIDARPGMGLGVEGHPHPALAGKRLVTALSIEGEIGSEWRIEVSSQSASSPYAPPTSAPKPRIEGVHTATVVGPPGEEIHVDEHGRVKVRFAWDRASEGDRTSCWLRVSQGWAGAGFGAVAVPRVGQEVLVAFLGGDPDAPIVVGRVYNEIERLPYALPEHKRRTVLRTRSTPASDGYSEIRIDDSAGAEHFYVQAERDYQQLVKRDRSVHVERDQSTTVDRDATTDVGVDESTTIGRDSHTRVGHDHRERVENDETLDVGRDRRVSVGGSLSESIAGTRRIHVGGDAAERIDGQHRHTVIGDEHRVTAGARLDRVEGSWHLKTRGDEAHAVDGSLSITAGGDAHLAVGGAHGVEAESIHVRAGTRLVIEAGARLTIQGPNGFIDFHDGGIDLVGKLVRINSGGTAGKGAGVHPTSPSDAEDADPGI